jgi:hypothetical protein
VKSKRILVALTIITSLISTPQAFPAGKSSIVIKQAGRSSTSIPNTILSGNGIPAKTIGIDGDFYIDIKNLNFYGPKTKGVWKLPTSLRVINTKESVAPLAGSDGAKGNSGEQGLTGTAGAKGADGTAGAKGADGAKGATGLTGPTGLTGSMGATGSIGAAGAPGSTGAKGETGLSGSVGTDGTDGTPGAKGADGSDGSPGTNGTNGTNGVDGAPGAKGADGSNGAPGISNAYWVALPSVSISAATVGGITDWLNFGAAPEAGSFIFEIILDGTFSGTDPIDLAISFQVLAAGFATSFHSQVLSSDAINFVNGTPGRHIQFLVTGTITSIATSSLLRFRVADVNGSISTATLTFRGNALITKVGSIG